MIGSGQKRKRGRPRNDELSALSDYIKVRVSPFEKKELIKCASSKHMTLSSYARQLLINSIYVSPEEYDSVGYFEDEEDEEIE